MQDVLIKNYRLIYNYTALNVSNMTKKEIESLNPSFKLENGFTMNDWFEVYEGNGYCTIRSGLRHADGVTKSPYHYEYFRGGKNASEEVYSHFINWWQNLNAA